MSYRSVLRMTGYAALVVFHLVWASVASGSNGKILACYYVPSNRVPISKIPADLCTHVIFAFADVTKDGIRAKRDSDIMRYSALTGLKKKNPNLRILLSLQDGFPTVVDAGQSTMQIFSKNATVFLRKYGFDGIDFDWEFPKQTQKDNYMKFLSIFRHSVNNEVGLNELSPLKRLQISMALSNNRFIAERSYDLKLLNQYIDFATVMTYDFHVYNARSDNITGYNSPLFSPVGESKFASDSGMLNYYVSAGLHRSKILMGMATYGRTYTLADPSKHGLHAPATGRGAGGPVIHTPGVYIMMEICMTLETHPGGEMDKEAGVPYMYTGSTWITYDNKLSFQLKCEWALQFDLGGFGVWALPLDDISGKCSGGPFPMVNTIKTCLK